MKAPSSFIPLGQLAPGQQAVVAELVGAPEQIHRLEEMGLRVGTPVRMVRPGSPCIVRLLGHKLCFRADDALHVLVVPEHGA